MNNTKIQGEQKSLMQRLINFVTSILPYNDDCSSITLKCNDGSSLSIDDYLKEGDISNTLFYVDTNCFCYLDKYENILNKIIKASKKIQRNFKAIQVLHAVNNELMTLKRREETAIQAKEALAYIKSIDNNLRFVGRKSDMFADNLLVAEVISNMTKKNIVVFTEDKKLSGDILHIDLNSTYTRYKIFIAKSY